MSAVATIASSWLLVMAAPSTDSGSPPPIAMAPVHETGQAPATIDASSIGDAIRAGLARGEVEVVPLAGSCSDRDCWIDKAREQGQDYVLLSEIVWKGPDQLVQLVVVDVASTEQIAATEGLCELCGQDEFVQSASNVAAQMVPRLSSLAPEPARLIIDGRPLGATVEVDGQVVGSLPWDGEVEPGEHTLRISHPGHAPLTRTITASPGVSEMASLELMTLPDDTDHSEDRRAVALGASLIAAGAIGAGVGVGLFVLDGRPYRVDCGPGVEDINGRCPQMYETTASASVAVALGGAALITGSILLVRALRERKRRGQPGAGLDTMSRRARTTIGLGLRPRFGVRF